MKSNANSFLGNVLSLFRQHPLIVGSRLFLIVIFPLFFTFWVFPLQLHVLIFIYFVYLIAFISFQFSNELKKRNGFQNHYQLITENLKDVVIIHRWKNGKTEYINDASKSILGYALDELVGQPSVLIIHPKDRYKVSDQLSNNSKLDDCFFIEKVRVRCKSGDYKWMELNVKTVKNRFGQSTTAIFILRDITETIELEEATKRFAEELYEKYRQLGQSDSTQKRTQLAMGT